MAQSTRTGEPSVTGPAAPGAGEGVDDAETRRRSHQEGRGREADKPSQLPAKGWKDIGKRVMKETKADNVPLLAGGVAFYALLALFPALVAVVSLYGLVADPAEVSKQLADFTEPLPAEARDLIVTQVESIAGSSSGSLGFGVAFGILAALWSASSGMKWMMTALSLAYDEAEGRKFVKLRGTALVLTVGAALAFVVCIALITATTAISNWVGLGDAGATVISIVRWPVLGALVVVGLAVLYRFGPDRDPAKWRWVSWGAGIATVIWLVSSGAFALYARFAGDFNESYGAIGGVVALMLWLFLTALSILLGAEINAEMEHQTAHDTTKGPDQPLGERHATVADELGETSDKG